MSGHQSPPAAVTSTPAAVGGHHPTRAECIQTAGELAAEHELAMTQMTPREQAEAAWTPTSPYTVDQLEDRIRAHRGLPPTHASKAS